MLLFVATGFDIQNSQNGRYLVFHQTGTCERSGFDQGLPILFKKLQGEQISLYVWSQLATAPM